jgi:hypothetical protein
LITDKAARILQKMKERDRENLKRWKPYNGPADWNLIVLNTPKNELEDARDERPGLSNG